MDGIDKTKLLERKSLPVGVLVPNESNPNKMKAREFDLLVDNIDKTGITDPILVRPVEDGKYRIVGGHHRFDAAKYLGFAEVPCTIITDPDFDQEQETFQLVRMNVIRGRMDPVAFVELYNKMAGKYQDDVLQDMLGFADEAEFKRLIAQTAKGLPKEMQAKFKEAAKEIKTIDGLAQLLNQMFTQHGGTLPYGYMIFDYGGKESVWLQIESATLKALKKVGDICIEKQRTMDDLLGALVQSIAQGSAAELLEEAVAKSKPVELPAGMTVMPTKENVSQLKQF